MRFAVKEGGQPRETAFQKFRRARIALSAALAFERQGLGPGPGLGQRLGEGGEEEEEEEEGSEEEEEEEDEERDDREFPLQVIPLGLSSYISPHILINAQY